jgi:hypothetical protein
VLLRHSQPWLVAKPTETSATSRPGRFSSERNAPHTYYWRSLFASPASAGTMQNSSNCDGRLHGRCCMRSQASVLSRSSQLAELVASVMSSC